MPKYLIERNMPNVGSLSHEDLAALADRSCRALHEIGSTYSGLKASLPLIRSTASILHVIKS